VIASQQALCCPLIGIARQTLGFIPGKDSADGEADESSVFLEAPGSAG
jgi:hypothetical protein